VDPKSSSNQSGSGGPRRSVDGVRRTGGTLAQPQTRAAAGAVAASSKAKTSRRQERKSAKQIKKATNKQMQQQPAPLRTAPLPVAAPISAEPELSQPRSSSKLKVFFQTLLAIIVILAVALAIVVLYVRYYQ
jgi:hypothetical protein